MQDFNDDKTVVLSLKEQQQLQQRVQQLKKRRSYKFPLTLILFSLLILTILVFAFSNQGSGEQRQLALSKQHHSGSDITQKLAEELKKSDIGCTEIPMGKSSDQVLWQNPMIQVLVKRHYLNMLQFDKQITLSTTSLGQPYFTQLQNNQIRFCYAKATLTHYQRIQPSDHNKTTLRYSYKLTAAYPWIKQDILSKMGPIDITGNTVTLAMDEG
ncbi:hypothetical protein [Piscirickettsia litoralis]|uniref:Uncharacterized protein n=1 Tax=Piscirickettsia litoralis TaxID=1891921 RepID=A0ABX3A0R7_9GAMM|nr:hypothetical protein [Piscirickettsia litoralis]ODN42048.1 hypothetical protein BGC07_02605 [Piscirickettsia litoralis]